MKRTRPNRSASAPANQPPNADVSNVTVPIRPASALVIAKAMIIAGITKENICTSIASSAQPPKQAQKVRFSTGVSSRYQLIALASSCVITVVIASSSAGMPRAAHSKSKIDGEWASAVGELATKFGGRRAPGGAGPLSCCAAPNGDPDWG